MCEQYVPDGGFRWRMRNGLASPTYKKCSFRAKYRVTVDNGRCVKTMLVCGIHKNDIVRRMGEKCITECCLL
jgi:hypothetical protein